jgi:putative DNA primase/helicase
MSQSEYAESVSESIIRQLEKGTAPWVKPWKAGERYMPYNPTTGNHYQGINAIWLLTVAESKGFDDSRWLTYKQAVGVDAQVNKGEKSTTIQFWKWHDEIPKLDEVGKPVLDEDGKPVKQLIRLQKPRVRSANVFNACQMEGLPTIIRPALSEWERHAEAEAILKDSGAVIQHLPSNRAFYRPSTDSITLPIREQFPSADNYYATALHELGHWTGHEGRLNRDLQHPFGSAGYAKEELRAEIASMMMGEQLSIGHDPSQHVAYIGSWIKALQEDPREIFKASADAERMVKYLRGREMQQEQEPVEQIQVPVLALAEGNHMTNTPERVYLDVPYAEKEAAKAMGAKWDRAEKSWYAAPSTEPEFLERWAKNRGEVSVQVDQDPQAEFAAALRSAGLVLDSAPVMNGELRRVQVEGDQRGEKSGSYIGFSDSHPAGYIKNYKTGYEANWKSSQRVQVLSAKDRARLDAEAAEKRVIRAKEREVLAEQTAKAVAAHWMAGDLVNEHPYLREKGVKSYGLRLNSLGAMSLCGSNSEEAPQQWSNKGELLVPVMDIDGKFWGAQSIDGLGRKSLPRGCRKQGGHHVIGEPEASDKLLFAEGYATAATLHELTSLPVIVAFDSGNLPVMAEAYREKYPDKLLVMAGDNDHSKPLEKNVGHQKAEEAAQKVGGHTLLPSFEKEASGSDWNDLVKLKGKKAVGSILQAGISLADLKHRAAQMVVQKAAERQEEAQVEAQKLIRAETQSLSL